MLLAVYPIFIALATSSSPHRHGSWMKVPATRIAQLATSGHDCITFRKTQSHGDTGIFKLSNYGSDFCHGRAKPVAARDWIIGDYVD